MATAPASFSTDPAGLPWEFAAQTDTGRLRRNNEDSIAFDPRLGLAVLADGMGGYAGGEVASEMAVALVQATLGRWLAQAGTAPAARAVMKALQQGIAQANRAVFSASNVNPALRGMGTTLVSAVFGPHGVVIGHIGDSRCYRLREGRLEALTRDHSFLQAQIDAGLMTPEEAMGSPHRNLVTRALGIGAEVEVDLAHEAVQQGDLYLLCSDGLTDMITDEQLESLLRHDIPLADKVALLITVANDNGGKDNVSVILARPTGAQ
ncbi:Stp1/IreP family PP2C-type Ser/Thr phosphatase [uncultured Pseudacidovorax sp.]|uniref:Stp1/IreP family PP2C-type Ser/Thr phosphatase n=1 Tax=uncultured Pseudacidovorax sp. TaxID=679313 RepID=UPI0025F1E122|nr:Stp1/IreP family PP2C-type Ser/Thr phosphatase [uncultured Pseudacidovorax sp.]